MASYEKRNGKWSVRFRFGEKNHRLSGYPSKKSAEKAYLEYITSLRDNMTLYNDKIILKDSIKSISKDISTPTNLSFMELYNSYIKEISLSLKPHTIYNIQSCFRKHIIPYFKDIVNIQSIDKSLMDDWLASLTVSTTSKLKYRERFRTFLKWVNDNYDQSIPIQKMAAIRNDDVPKEMTIWTREQFNVFIATIQEPMMSALFNFLYYSGCRLSEALGLTYADIKDNKVYITKQRSHKGNSTTTTKTKSSRRLISMPPRIIEILYALRPDHTGYIFTYDGGTTSYCQTAIGHRWTRYISKVDLPKIRIHDLRHSHASYLISSGVPITAVSRRLGHASPTITMSIYAHSLPSDEDVIMRVLS